ncbi:unnamed protein product [Diamesa serratosioi]
MSALFHEFCVFLERQSSDIPWGFRLAGGSDLNAPLIIIRVHPNSPAQKELLRGDIITKVDEYDGRDISHKDAEMLFRTADNKIRLVVRRDNKIAMNSSKINPIISSLPPAPMQQTYTPGRSSVLTTQEQFPHRAPSPIPRGPQSMAAACAAPLESLPHTVFNNNNQYAQQQQQQYQQQQYQQQQQQHVNYPPAPPLRSCFSPQLTRDHYQETDDDNSAIQNQPYRTTPLILPGAKVKRDVPQESYLRHHPSPQMRAAPFHDYSDIMMRQKVADSVLNRVVGEEQMTSNGPKVVHKQFNSPIGLYSDNNIETTIKQTVSPGSMASAVPYKKTVVYDPLKSETYRAIQENSFNGGQMQEVNIPVQQKVFQPNRMVPGKKPSSSYPPPDPQHRQQQPMNGMDQEVIHQSGSFKRLMYHVLGETDY